MRSRKARSSENTEVRGFGILLFALLIPGAVQAASDNVVKGAPELQDKSPQPLQVKQAAPAPSSFVLPPIDGKSAGISILVAAFRFEGNTVFSTEELQQLTSPYIGRHLSPVELEQVRIEITRKYTDAGYINSGAVLGTLPGPNGYPDNVIPMRILEGRIDDVHIKGMERLNKRYAESRLIKAGEVFNINTMQDRFRLLLTDPLFEKINSRIIPGDAPGKAVLDIDVVRASPYGMTVFANNYRPPSIGSEGGGVSGWVRNLTGWGDTLDVNMQHSRGADPIHLGWTMPVGGDGTVLRASIDRGNSSVVEEPLTTIDIRSYTHGFEVGIEQSLVEKLERKITLGLGYNQRENSTTLLGQPFSFTPGEPDGVSRVRVVRFSQEWTERRESQALVFRSVFAFGANNVDPAGATAPVADRRYTVWTGQTQYVHNLSDKGTQFLLRASVQKTPNRLLPMERFSIGGVGTVRGYRENSVVRDEGYVASAELRHPLWGTPEGRRQLSLTGFVDHGGGVNKDEGSQKLSSIGLGLSGRRDKWLAELYFARRLNDLPNQPSGNLQDKGIHFQISCNVI